MNDIRKLQAAIGRYHAPPGHMRLNVSTQRRRKAASAGATASAVTFAPASGSSPVTASYLAALRTHTPGGGGGGGAEGGPRGGGGGGGGGGVRGRPIGRWGAGGGERGGRGGYLSYPTILLKSIGTPMTQRMKKLRGRRGWGGEGRVSQACPGEKNKAGGREKEEGGLTSLHSPRPLPCPPRRGPRPRTPPRTAARTWLPSTHPAQPLSPPAASGSPFPRPHARGGGGGGAAERDGREGRGGGVEVSPRTSSHLPVRSPCSASFSSVISVPLDPSLPPLEFQCGPLRLEEPQGGEQRAPGVPAWPPAAGRGGRAPPAEG